MKKGLSFLLAMLLTLALLAGCGGNTSSAGGTPSVANEGGEPAAVQPEETNFDEDPYTVVITYPLIGPVPADIQLIEEAVNKIALAEINVQIELFPVSAFDLQTQTNLMISTGEELDLMLCFFDISPMSGYVNKGQVIELDELFELYGQDILEAEGVAMAGGYFDGTLYSIPTEEKMARQSGLLLRNDILEKYDLGLAEGEYITYEIMDEWFAAIKAGEGSDFYMLAASANEIASFYDYLNNVDKLGDSVAGGVLANAGRDDTKVINVFETEEYKNHITWMRKWYQAGYINPDIATIAESLAEQMKTGRYFGTVGYIEADMEFNVTRDYGMEMKVFPAGPPFITTALYQNTAWAIPITCDDPVATMKFLNLMYGSEEICNLLHNGIEGMHYETTDSPGIIRYPDGVEVSTTGYNNPLGIWGDKSKKYQWEPAPESYFEDLAAFNSMATADASYASKALGFTFNSEPVKTELAAVNDVMSQYRATLESGSVDPDTILPDFLAALEAAGVNVLIEEKQTQLDEWLAGQ